MRRVELGQAARWEYFRVVYGRYGKAEGKSKGGMLDEFCLNTGYHRKYAIRLLNGPPPGRHVEAPARGRKPRYGSAVVSLLAAVWEAAGYPWSVRLKALLPSWMPWIRQRFTCQNGCQCWQSPRKAIRCGSHRAPSGPSVPRRLRAWCSSKEIAKSDYIWGRPQWDRPPGRSSSLRAQTRYNPACTAAMRASAAQSRSPSPRAMAARKRSRSTPASGIGTAADSAASCTSLRSLKPSRSLKPAGSNCSLAIAAP